MEFDRGIRRFGYLLTSAMLVMVLLVFVAHVFRGRPPIETLLFSVALAVGLSPELLPAILTVNLARGAQAMARGGVVVRRLSAIENLGSMDVLCTDKTGTLTEGVVALEGAYDASGARSTEVLEIAACHSELESGVSTPLDEAILRERRGDLTAVRKLGEIPFDFVRKRVSVVLDAPRGVRLVTKGAFHHVLDACAQLATGPRLDSLRRGALEAQFERWSAQGVRVLALAARTIDARPSYTREDERDLEFVGFLTFKDSPKAGAAAAIADLATLGVQVKLITGDSGLVARHVAALVGMRADRVLTGQQLDDLHDDALWHAAERTDPSSRSIRTRRSGSSYRSRRWDTWSASWVTA
jgi:Mg2+-importing ATPase